MNKDIFLSNSLGNKKEKFIPMDQKKVGMYVCGPTVYDLLHVGNFRGPIFFNFLRNKCSALIMFNFKLKLLKTALIFFTSYFRSSPLLTKIK